MEYSEVQTYLTKSDAKEIKKVLKNIIRNPVTVKMNVKGNNLVVGTLPLTQAQRNKLEKGKIFDLKLSIKQLNHMKSHYGGFLPLALIPGLIAALGGLAGGAAGVAKTVIDKKAQDKILDEQIRHNKAMEGGRLYLNPQKTGGCVDCPMCGSFLGQR